jgi:hypothetical protein
MTALIFKVVYHLRLNLQQISMNFLCERKYENFLLQVSFVATFVGENRKDISTYWLNVRSDPIHVVHV